MLLCLWMRTMNAEIAGAFKSVDSRIGLGSLLLSGAVSRNWLAENDISVWLWTSLDINFHMCTAKQHKTTI